MLALARRNLSYFKGAGGIVIHSPPTNTLFDIPSYGNNIEKDVATILHHDLVTTAGDNAHAIYVGGGGG